MNKNKNLAFTLAEVLIVIGIIGVVAALTLPNLNHATGDKEKVTKVKKIYSTLSEAFDRATAIYGPMDEWFKNTDDEHFSANSELLAKRVTEFMKVSKVCGFNPEGCVSNSVILLLDGSESEQTSVERSEGGEYSVLLPDGMSLGFRFMTAGEVDEDYNLIKSGVWAAVRVDIDGPQKGKNQIGHDLFDFTYAAGDVSGPNDNCPLNQLWHGGVALDDNNLPMVYQTYIAAWVIEFGNLDYLRCPDELVNGKTSCE